MKTLMSTPDTPNKCTIKIGDKVIPRYGDLRRVAFDLDGTLCTNEKRYAAVAKIMGGGNLHGHVTAEEITAEMNKFPMYTDEPTPLTHTVKFIHEAGLADVWYLTARLDNLRAETELWLCKMGLPHRGNLIMRPTTTLPASELPSNAEYKLEVMATYGLDLLVEDDLGIIRHIVNRGKMAFNAFHYMKAV